MSFDVACSIRLMSVLRRVSAMPFLGLMAERSRVQVWCSTWLLQLGAQRSLASSDPRLLPSLGKETHQILELYELASSKGSEREL